MVTRKKTRHVKHKKHHSDLEERFEDFSKEVEVLGKRFEKHGKRWDSWFHNTFGLVGPLISSIIGLIVLVILINFMSFVNLPIGNSFISVFNTFLISNIGLFFLFFLFFSYSSYFSKSMPKTYHAVSPILSSIGASIGLWVLMRVLRIANLSLKSPIISEIAGFIEVNLVWIFVLILIIGYISLVFRKEKTIKVHNQSYTMKREKHKDDGIRRLYRSGNDKILGGVCGGIAEYLGVDPVLIRLLFVLATLAWGTGILFYIIAWIIIPRNPNHKWKD